MFVQFLGLFVFPLVIGAYQPTTKGVGLAIKTCNSLSEELCKAVPACAFCRSRSGEAHCFASAVTATLPDDLYPCRFLNSPGPNNACEGKSEADCKSTSCAWCVSAAVGNACYTPEDAKLPSAIFSCTMPAALELMPVPQGTHAQGAGVESLGTSPLTLGSQVQSALWSGATSEASTG